METFSSCQRLMKYLPYPNASKPRQGSVLTGGRSTIGKFIEAMEARGLVVRTVRVLGEEATGIGGTTTKKKQSKAKLR